MLVRRIELIGLPGVGKSYVRDVVAERLEIRSVPLAMGLSLRKLRSVARGAIRHPRVLFHAAAGLRYLPERKAVRRWAILLERIGESKPGELRDEGILQALWALHASLPITAESVAALAYLIQVLPIPDHVFLVTASSKDHGEFISGRNRQHPANVGRGSDERRWLAILVVLLRRRGEIELFRHRNAPRATPPDGQGGSTAG